MTVNLRRAGSLRRIEVPVGPTCPLPPDNDGGISVSGRPAPVATADSGASDATTQSALNALAPNAALGFGLLCQRCTFDQETQIWTFDEEPQIDRVRPGTLAWEWGVPWGGRITAVDGASITTLEGGRRFSAIQPGDSVTWTARRFGRQRRLTTLAMAPSEAAAARQVALTGDPVSDSMRLVLTTRTGPVDLEIRRHIDPDTQRGIVILPGRDEMEVVIRIDGHEIRVRVPPPTGG